MLEKKKNYKTTIRLTSENNKNINLLSAKKHISKSSLINKILSSYFNDENYFSIIIKLLNRLINKENILTDINIKIDLVLVVLENKIRNDFLIQPDFTNVDDSQLEIQSAAAYLRFIEKCKQSIIAEKTIIDKLSKMQIEGKKYNVKK